MGTGAEPEADDAPAEATADTWPAMPLARVGQQAGSGLPRSSEGPSI